jgi:hypothetical protein
VKVVANTETDHPKCADEFSQENHFVGQSSGMARRPARSGEMRAEVCLRLLWLFAALCV